MLKSKITTCRFLLDYSIFAIVFLVAVYSDLPLDHSTETCILVTLSLGFKWGVAKCHAQPPDDISANQLPVCSQHLAAIGLWPSPDPSREFDLSNY
jgi:hypothetical protein